MLELRSGPAVLVFEYSGDGALVLRGKFPDVFKCGAAVEEHGRWLNDGS